MERRVSIDYRWNRSQVLKWLKPVAIGVATGFLTIPAFTEQEMSAKFKIPVEEMIGKEYGRWTVIERDVSNSTGCYLSCRCSCGTIRSIYKSSIGKGSVSCGCLQREWKARVQSRGVDNEKKDIEYRDVVGFEGYRIGDDGTVMSCKNQSKEWRILHPSRMHDGKQYRLRVCLQKNGKASHRLVHTLVLEAFVGPRPQGMVSCHFPDPNPENCRLSNLRWGTRLDNANDAIIQGTVARGEKSGQAKMTDEKVRIARELHKSGLTCAEIASKFGLSRGAMEHICYRRTWRHVADKDPEIG